MRVRLPLRSRHSRFTLPLAGAKLAKLQWGIATPGNVPNILAMTAPPPTTPDRPLCPGLYDHLVTEELQRVLAEISDPGLFVTSALDPEDSHTAIAQYVETVLVRLLTTVRDGDGRERQRRLANRLIGALAEELGKNPIAPMLLADPLRRLLAFRDGASSPADRPDTPLARSALLTGTRLDPALGVQIRKELASADRVDILCSFIKWSGVIL